MFLDRHLVELFLSFPLERTSEGADIPVYIQHIDDLGKSPSTLSRYMNEIDALQGLVRHNLIVKVNRDPACYLYRLTNPQGRLVREIIEAAHKKVKQRDGEDD